MRANGNRQETTLAAGTAHRALSSPLTPAPSSPWPCVPYPWVPEQLGEHHQVGRGEGEAHVGSGDGQHGHGVPLGQLELLAQALSVCRGCGAINADVLHLLRDTGGK